MGRTAMECGRGGQRAVPASAAPWLTIQPLALGPAVQQHHSQRENRDVSGEAQDQRRGQGSGGRCRCSPPLLEQSVSLAHGCRRRMSSPLELYSPLPDVRVVNTARRGGAGRGPVPQAPQLTGAVTLGGTAASAPTPTNSPEGCSYFLASAAALWPACWRVPFRVGAVVVTHATLRFLY